MCEERTKNRQEKKHMCATKYPREKRFEQGAAAAWPRPAAASQNDSCWLEWVDNVRVSRAQQKYSLFDSYTKMDDVDRIPGQVRSDPVFLFLEWSLATGQVQPGPFDPYVPAYWGGGGGARLVGVWGRSAASHCRGQHNSRNLGSTRVLAPLTLGQRLT